MKLDIRTHFKYTKECILKTNALDFLHKVIIFHTN
jgi:hypothetical protein